MTLGKIERIIDAVRHERYRFKPVRRRYIPKKDGKQRPLVCHRGRTSCSAKLEDWVWNATLSGAPQGGVLSPCLSNIYLDRLDKFVETALLPGHTRGVRRSPNPEYHRIKNGIYRARKRGDHAMVRALRKQQRRLPTLDPQDPEYRRLRYIRYADDILLGFTGPKTEAEEIKRRLAQFLQEDLKLEPEFRRSEAHDWPEKPV
jgi:hypothetical protein